MTPDERKLFMDMGETIARLRATLQWEPGQDKVSLRSTNDADDLASLSTRYDHWFWEQAEGKALMVELEK